MRRKLWWIIAIFILILFAVIPMFITMKLYKQTFGVRVETENNFYEYLSRMYPGFERRATTFLSNEGQRLRGYFYGYKKDFYKGLIIISHGMGGGHDSYLTEAEYFARNDYVVFAYDNTGTNASEGESLVGLSQSVIDLEHALRYIKAIPELSAFPVLLYGHSWGGYAVATVNKEPYEVKAIVSVAGFEKNSNVIKEQGKYLVGPFIDFFMPYVNLYERILFGENAKRTGSLGLSKTDAQVLLIHSKDDTIVNYQDNFGKYQETFQGNPRFAFLSLTEHGHNGVLSPEANAAIKKIQAKRGDLLPEEQEELEKLDQEEKASILKLDAKVMEQILTFYNTYRDQ